MKLFERFVKRCPNSGEIVGFQKPKSFLNLLWFPIMGLASLIWVIVRVVPKPSRLTYPCMQVATPAGLSFLAYLGGLFVSIFSVKKGKSLWRHTKHPVAIIIILFGIGFGVVSFLQTQDNLFASKAPVSSLNEDFVPIDPPNTPMGVARGIFPGRVAWVYNPDATSWDGEDGYWWEDQNNNQDAVNQMMSEILQSLSGASNDADAWAAIFTYFNQRHEKGDVGYQSGEKIAIKLNLNKSGSVSTKRNQSFPSPHTVFALINELVNEAGVAEEDITLYDVNRVVPDPVYDKVHATFPGVHYMGNYGSRGREMYVRSDITIKWSQELTMEIGGGHPAYLPTTITEAAYMISLASFKAHRYVGVTGCAKNHFGSFSCDDDNGKVSANAPKSAGLHPYITVRDFIIPGSESWSFLGREMGTYNPLVDIMGNKYLGENTVLFLTDALYGVEDEQVDVSLNSKWLSSPFNNDWTSSLFASLDDVALSSVGIDFYRYEQSINDKVYSIQGSVDNYLHEAAQADNPPSGTLYDPDGDGVPLASLGVHEHWNNPEDKQYSRNLGTGDGIELVKIMTTSSVESVDAVQPSSFVLHQNYPNPFNPSTTLKYEVPKLAQVNMDVYDLSGRHVTELVNQTQSAGVYEAKWNGLTDNGLLAPSGMYLVRVRMAQGSEVSQQAIKITLEK